MADPTGDQLRPLLLQLIFGFFPAQVLYVAARLGIPDLLANGPQRADRLAQTTSTHAGALSRLLRALAYLGVLEETEPGCFGLTDLGALLRRDVPDSMWATTLLFCGEGAWRSWGSLLTSVRTGQPAFEAGEEPCTRIAADPQASAEFNQAMSEGTRRDAPGIVESYDFRHLQRLVDVGGGDGTLLAAILAATPDLHGVVFDTAAGLAQAAARLEAAGVADRAEVVGGDFFESVPEGADGYLMKSVIHDWDDERCVTILANCRRAMADHAKVLIVEPVLPDTVTPSFRRLGVIMSDLNMLLNTTGRERTEAEFRSLLGAADLGLVRIVPIPPPSDYSILEATPA